MEYNINQPLLIKLGSEENMKNLYEKGELFLQTFDYFKKLEKTADGRADPDEYIGEYYAGKGLKKVSFELGFRNPQTNEIEKHKLSPETGTLSVAIGSSNQIYSHLYCMSVADIRAIRQQSKLIFSENFAETKDYAVVVFNYEEFLSRIKNALKANDYAPAAVGKIKYVSRDNHNGDMGCFCKFNDFSYQNEWRLAVAMQSDTAQKLYIGSMQDIAFEPVYKDTFLKTKVLIKEIA